MLDKPCSCQGNNPNCSRCGGWGYIDEISEARSSVGQGEMKPPKIIKSKKKKVTNHSLGKSGNRPPKNQHLGIKCLLCGKHPIDPKTHNCIDNAGKDEHIMKQIERLLRRN